MLYSILRLKKYFYNSSNFLIFAFKSSKLHGKHLCEKPYRLNHNRKIYRLFAKFYFCYPVFFSVFTTLLSKTERALIYHKSIITRFMAICKTRSLNNINDIEYFSIYSARHVGL